MVLGYRKHDISVSLLVRAFAILSFALNGCAYRLGSPEKSLPGGYKQITVPIFKNGTMEPGLEVTFTNSLIQEFERSRIARVVEGGDAEASIQGEITGIEYFAGGMNELSYPDGAVLASQYRIVISVRIKLVRQSDKTVLWTSDFTTERTYVAPQVTAPGVNTVNPLYNLSARRQNIDVMAGELMNEAHDRMTENF